MTKIIKNASEVTGIWDRDPKPASDLSLTRDELQDELDKAGKALAELRKERDAAISQTKQLQETHHRDKVVLGLSRLINGKKLNGPNEDVNAVLRNKIISDSLEKADWQFDETGELVALIKGTDQKILNPATQQPDVMSTVIEPVGLKYFAKSDPKPNPETQRVAVVTEASGNDLTPQQRERLAALAQNVKT